jgi:hypothetical protein
MKNIFPFTMRAKSSKDSNNSYYDEPDELDIAKHGSSSIDLLSSHWKMASQEDLNMTIDVDVDTLSGIEIGGDNKSHKTPQIEEEEEEQNDKDDDDDDDSARNNCCSTRSASTCCFESSLSDSSGWLMASIPETNPVCFLSDDNDDDNDEPAPAPPRLAPARTKKVDFSTVQFREYPIRVGDNPAVTRGVPITIGWEHFCDYQLRVDKFEEVRPPRRQNCELKLKSLERVRLLKREGSSGCEIQEGINDANLAQNRRQRTRQWMHLSPLEEFFERIQRSFLNATTHRAAKRRERALLKECRRCRCRKVVYFKDDSVYTATTDGSRTFHTT